MLFVSPGTVTKNGAIFKNSVSFVFPVGDKLRRGKRRPPPPPPLLHDRGAAWLNQLVKMIWPTAKEQVENRAWFMYWFVHSFIDFLIS